MSAITTHVLDTSRGRPATGVGVALERGAGGEWIEVGRGTTDDDGRVADLSPAGSDLVAGRYRITFETGDYYALRDTPTLYPRVTIEFLVADAGDHYHVPLLLSPFGYATYRGS